MAYPSAEKLTLRDKLAIERTHLAKERTILAYVRTGITLAGLAAVVYRFFDFGTPLYNAAIAVIIGAPGLVLTLYGLYRVFFLRIERKNFERQTNCVDA